MSFENDYIKILKFAKGKAFGLQIEAEDLVNEAYLKLYDKPYSIDSYYKEISNQFLIEKHNGRSDISYGTAGNPHPEFSGDYVCTCCKETKTAHEFRISSREFGKKVLQTRCKDCERKLLLTYYHKVKNTDAYKKYNKANFKKHVDKNRKKWNRYLQERQKKETENLTDAYIRKCIRNKYKGKENAKQYLENPVFMKQYKDQLILKRERSKLKLQVGG